MSTESVQTKHQWFKHLDFFAIDFVITMAVYFASCFVRLYQINADFVDIYKDMAVALIPMIVLVQLGTNPHRDVLNRPGHKEFYASMEYISEVTILLLLYQYLTKVGGEFSRGAFVYFWFFGTIFVFLSRMLYKRIVNRVRAAKSRKTKVILVIDRNRAEEEVQYFYTHGENQYCISAVALLDQTKDREEVEALQIDQRILKILGETEIDGVSEAAIITDLDGLYSYAENNSSSEILISISDSDTEKRIIREMLMMGITSHVNLNRGYENMPNMQVETLADQLVITASIQPFSPFQRVLKRLADIVGAFVGLVITFVVMLIIGPIIKIQSPGPVFFSQIRVGKNGKRFKMYKFRSMYVDAEKRKAALMEKNEMNGPIFKIADDPRITPIGKFIRKYSLDELPQFWNVLKGDMSIVGTRPPTVDEWNRYTSHHKARLAIKPGITGLWQVSGRNDITDFEEVVALDLKYIQGWSVLEDARIIIRTVGVVLGAVGAK